MSETQQRTLFTQQAGLDLPPAPLSWDRLVRGAENETAIALVDRPGSWALAALCLTGPKRCGLTTLAGLVAQRHGGTSFPAKAFINLTRKDVAAIAGTYVCIDDAEQAATSAPETLLTLLNLSAVEGGHVLLAAHSPPGRWQTRSADLKSRLLAMPVVEIQPPGEAFVRDWLAAAAARQYMRLSLETLNYLVPRLDLRYEAAEILVRQLSEAVTSSGRAPGIALARQVLEGIHDDGDGDLPDASSEG